MYHIHCHNVYDTRYAPYNDIRYTLHALSSCNSLHHQVCHSPDIDIPTAVCRCDRQCFLCVCLSLSLSLSLSQSLSVTISLCLSLFLSLSLSLPFPLCPSLSLSLCLSLSFLFVALPFFSL